MGKHVRGVYMMKTLYLNDQGDLEFDGQNNLRMVEGAGEKIQAVRLLLQTNAGEWFLNTGHGLGYLSILGQKPDDEELRAVFMAAFEQEPRIEEVLSLDFEFNRTRRHLTVSFKVRMEGEVIEGQEVI